MILGFDAMVAIGVRQDRSTAPLRCRSPCKREARIYACVEGHSAAMEIRRPFSLTCTVRDQVRRLSLCRRSILTVVLFQIAWVHTQGVFVSWCIRASPLRLPGHGRTCLQRCSVAECSADMCLTVTTRRDAITKDSRSVGWSRLHARATSAKLTAACM